MRFNWFGLIASMISLTLGGNREYLLLVNIFLALPMDMNELNFQPYPNGLQKRISKIISAIFMVSKLFFFRSKHPFGNPKQTRKQEWRKSKSEILAETIIITKILKTKLQ